MVEIQGADATSATVSALNSFGAVFVCRYLSPPANTWKNLTLSEAQALQAGGIQIVSNWEYGTDDYQGGYSQGVSYANSAASMHQSCGGPPAAPIYFSVDADINPSDCEAYFQGIVAALGVARVGVYGSTAVCQYLKAQGLVSYTWRTMSTDWQGGAGSPADFNIVQTGEYDSDYDSDVAYTEDYGQWSAHAAPSSSGGSGGSGSGSGGGTPPPSGPDYQYNATHNTYTPVAVDGDFGPASWSALQFVLGVTVDGNPGPVTISALQTMLAVWGSPAVALTVDGQLGPDTTKAFQEKVGVTQDGDWGPATSTAAQNMLNAGTLYGSN